MSQYYMMTFSHAVFFHVEIQLVTACHKNNQELKYQSTSKIFEY